MYLCADMNSVHFLESIKSIVTGVEPGAMVYLFGSRASGFSKPESDWDILILINRDKITPELEARVKNPLYDLELETGQVISPLLYTQKDWNFRQRATPFYASVMTTGKQL